jgi:hypothetical protein
MNVQRMVVSEHALLRDLAAYAAALAVPPGPIVERGDWLDDVLAGPPPPPTDRNRPAAYRFVRMAWWPQPSWMPADATIASVNYFPSDGAGLGWHTDAGSPGWRVYLGRPLDGVSGEFLFVKKGGGDPIVLRDYPALATAFYVSGEPCSSWHAVAAHGARFSVGIRIHGDATARALGLL